MDTREAAGPYGAPSIDAGGFRSFVLVGQCGIPAGATAVSLNFTVTQSTAAGHIAAFPAGTPVPFVSTLNYRAGQTRANNAIVTLGQNGAIAVVCSQSDGKVDVIIDVNGYFRSPQ